MNDELGIVVVVAFAAAILSGIAVGAATERRWQEQAIERGYAQFCPLDGEFAWNGECADAK